MIWRRVSEDPRGFAKKRSRKQRHLAVKCGRVKHSWWILRLATCSGVPLKAWASEKGLHPRTVERWQRDPQFLEAFDRIPVSGD